MATAKKQKSGNWRIQVYLGRDAAGKQIIKSFTGRTKKEAESLAKEYKSRNIRPTSTTVRVAIADYIDARTVILSPATIRHYRSLERRCEERLPGLMAMRIDIVDTARLQRAINVLSAECAPTTVNGFYVLITAALRAKGYYVRGCKLPRITKREPYIPSLDLARQIFAAAQGTELELPIILAAAGLRAGEICAVRPEDFSGDVLHVSRDLVKTADGEFVTKPPKTAASDRYVRLPAGVAERITTLGFATRHNPESLSMCHSRFLKKNGYPHFRLHDWRHFMVSSLHASGLPDAFIQQMGGWSSERVMKGVYRHLMADGVPAMAEKATACLGDLLPGAC